MKDVANTASEEELDYSFTDYFNYDPYSEIKDYTKFHDAIDRFVWLLRLYYSDKENIKSKKYRIDILFQKFILGNKITLNKCRKFIGERNSKDQFEYFLKQGWYNELSISYPFLEDPFELGTSIAYSKNSWKFDLFPSWFIVKSYYTAYSFYNSLVFANTDNLNTFQHRKTTNHFNNSLLKKISKMLCLYPFNLSEPLVDELNIIRKNYREFWKYNYSKYPREIDKDFYSIEADFLSDLTSLKTELKTISTVSIIDLLYRFRIWANYIGNETVVKLRSGGLLLFLERNLTTIVFFIAGISELIGIALLGEQRFKEIYLDFYQNFIGKKEELMSNWYLIPQINRLRIYNHLGLIQKIDEVKPPKYDSLILIQLSNQKR